MELEELIVEIVIGLFLLFTSYQIGIKENITLLHGYPVYLKKVLRVQIETRQMQRVWDCIYRKNYAIGWA